MTDTALSERTRLFADKNLLKQQIQQQNALIGLIHDPEATAEQARMLILAEGVRPEDNVFSCGIIAARDED